MRRSFSSPPGTRQLFLSPTAPYLYLSAHLPHTLSHRLFLYTHLVVVSSSPYLGRPESVGAASPLFPAPCNTASTVRPLQMLPRNCSPEDVWVCGRVPRCFHSAVARALDAFVRATAFSLRLTSRLRFCTPLPRRGPTTLGNRGTNPAPPCCPAEPPIVVVTGPFFAAPASLPASPAVAALFFAACRCASFAARCRARSPFFRFGRSAAEKVDRRRVE